MRLNEKSLVLPLKQPFQIIADKINTSEWCLIPEAFGMQLETLNIISQELELSKEYLGSKLEKGLSNE
jgi:hypothetical protein